MISCEVEGLRLSPCCDSVVFFLVGVLLGDRSVIGFGIGMCRFDVGMTVKLM